MKIKATFNKNDISDKLSIDGNELTITREDNQSRTFDIENLKPQDNENKPEKLEIIQGMPDNPTEEEVAIRDEEILQFDLDHQCYIENGVNYMNLSVAMNRNFLFMNNNYLTFHDKNMNGEFELEELTEFIAFYNMDNADRIEGHRQIYVEFCLKSVSDKNSDKARVFYNSRTPGTLRANYTLTLNQFIANNGLDEVFKAEVMAGYEAWLKHVEDCMKVK